MEFDHVLHNPNKALDEKHQLILLVFCYLQPAWYYRWRKYHLKKTMDLLFEEFTPFHLKLIEFKKNTPHLCLFQTSVDYLLDLRLWKVFEESEHNLKEKCLKSNIDYEKMIQFALYTQPFDKTFMCKEFIESKINRQMDENNIQSIVIDLAQQIHPSATFIKRIGDKYDFNYSNRDSESCFLDANKFHSRVQFFAVVYANSQTIVFRCWSTRCKGQYLKYSYATSSFKQKLSK